MKFIIEHKNGNTKTIEAKDLDHAEEIANQKWKNWINIRIKDFKGEKL